MGISETGHMRRSVFRSVGLLGAEVRAVTKVVSEVIQKFSGNTSGIRIEAS